jgi:hypothetical protein
MPSIHLLWVAITALTAAASAAAAASPDVSNRPLAAPGPAQDGPLFARRPASETGLDFRHTWDPPPEYASARDRNFAGGGVAIGDCDGDGLADVYLSRPFGGGKLFRNKGGWRFEDATAASGLDGDRGWTTAGAWGDVDNDGDLDLYICGLDCPNRLWMNDGRGRFTERAAAAGLAFAGSSVMMAWSDYDGDGDLDGYLLTNRTHSNQPLAVTSPETMREVMRRLQRTPAGGLTMPAELEELYHLVPRPGGSPVVAQAGQYDRLFRNDGAGPEGVPQFTDVTRAAGILDNGLGLSATWWDHDGDGRPDLYVANDYFGGDKLWHNNGDGTFTDRAAALLPHTAWFSMGSDVADINNDGRLDLFVADMAGSNHYKDKMSMGDMDQLGWFLEAPTPRQYMRNTLFLNSGAGPFMEIAHLAGVAATDWTWAVKFADLDGDGWQDLYVTNGMTGDFLNSDLRSSRNRPLSEAPVKRDVHFAFRNRGDLTFENVSAAWGLDHEGVSFGAAYGDLDGDGDPDLVVNHFEAQASVYENRSTTRRAAVRLVGRKSNHRGLDARLVAEVGPQRQTRYLTLARGFAGSDEPVVHFGLGRAERIDRLTVHWPGGTIQEVPNLAAGQLHSVTEPEGAPAAPPAAEPPPRLLEPTQALASARHVERPFDDFQRQPLLPNKSSQLGPGLAWGDVDGDGDTDCFLAGAAGQPGTLWLNQGPGPQGTDAFQPATVPALAADAACEDLGAIFFEADGDGDPDLYVVSGGVECEPGAPVLRDRLYLNDGRGGFTKAPDGALPDERDSGSCVAAADFDRDGDLDLFVGGRVIPGQYPASPGSRLLLNDGTGVFADVTAMRAPSLGAAGLVTAALWTDVDADGWTDLLLAAEWHPLRFFRNTDGILNDATAGSGLEGLSGWWNGLAAGDFDEDGDLDYAATNFGLNTKYHPSTDHPVRVFYGDFDGSGGAQIVEAKEQPDGRWLPVRGKSCSQNAMPFLRQKFPTFHQFASATLQEIYGPALTTARHLAVTTLQSGVVWNKSVPGAQGPGRRPAAAAKTVLAFQPLPMLAQVAPAFGVQAADFNGDGHLDLALAHNFFSPQRETGRMDGGLGAVLIGDGKGGFHPAWPDASGLVLQADAKAMTLADLNRDGRDDLVVSVNNGPTHAWLSATAAAPARPLELRGPPGNPHAVGARIVFRTASGGQRAAEIHLGEGYLSQPSPQRRLRLPQGTTRVEIRWPKGATTTHRVEGDSSRPLVVSSEVANTEKTGVIMIPNDDCF